jgi:small subunit ribosomal protein S6
VDKWGKRRLAYEIQKKQYGFYFTLEFEGEGDIPAVLQSEYNYNDNVLRYLTYKYDKHKLKAMEQGQVTRATDDDEQPHVKKQVEVKPEVAKEVVPEATVEETSVVEDEKPEVVEEETATPEEEDAPEVVAEEPSTSKEETPEIAEEEEESTKEAKDE